MAAWPLKFIQWTEKSSGSFMIKQEILICGNVEIQSFSWIRLW